MVTQDGILYRVAEARDVFPVMRLYQIATSGISKDSVFLDAKRLLEAIQSPHSPRIVGERNGEIKAVFSILIDKADKIAKINRLYIDPHWEDWERMLREALPLLVSYLTADKRAVEVIYTISRNFSPEQEKMTWEMGFKILGIIPNHPLMDGERLNGLTSYFVSHVLDRKRYSDFALHPLVAPLYEITREQCGLNELKISEAPSFGPMSFERLPALELIHAPQFVAHKFGILNERKSLSIHFYPFTTPNAMITDPAGKIEIYVKVMPGQRMATIIGERLDIAVSPAELYREVARILAHQNISYIEAINDAADVWGIECFANAGYLPCAYFPALKSQGERRRDYVVLARTFERLLGGDGLPRDLHPAYLRYLTAFHKLEARGMSLR